MDHLDLMYNQLSIEKANDLVKSPHCGAISFFVGTTRDNFDGKVVLKLEYEAYKEMAIRSMKSLCDKVREKYESVENIVIHHRLGVVPVTEASVIIAASSVHRKEAMETTEFLINELKRTVPIWKKEFYNDSDSNWKENKEFLPDSARTVVADKTSTCDGVQRAVLAPTTPQHLVQIKAGHEEIERRIDRYVARKRAEINAKNVREFCRRDATKSQDDESSLTTCARIDSILTKRKDSKSHLQVNRVLNTYNRDDESSAMLMKFQPKNGLEERLVNVEVQLSLSKPTPKDVYVRLKKIEDRLLEVESMSSEYAYIWGKDCLTTATASSKSTHKKRVFTTMEIDDLIRELKNKRRK